MASSPVIDKFLDAIASAAIPASAVWSADATLDATVPNWRMHVAGPDVTRSEYARWFADAASSASWAGSRLTWGAGTDRVHTDLAG